MVIFKMFLLHWITLEDDGNDKSEQRRCRNDQGQADPRPGGRIWFKIGVFGA